MVVPGVTVFIALRIAAVNSFPVADKIITSWRGLAINNVKRVTLNLASKSKLFEFGKYLILRPDIGRAGISAAFACKLRFWIGDTFNTEQMNFLKAKFYLWLTLPKH